MHAWGLASGPIEAATSRIAWRPEVDRASVDAMRAEVSSLPPADGETWWAAARRELRDHMLHDDPSRFLRWRVVQRTLVEREFSYINAELHSLRARDLREDALGAPAPFLRKPRSSGNLIHHAYVIERFEQVVGRPIRDVGTVVEFGGGYGSLARLFRRRGHTDRYHIHDFPELTALQRFYLSNVCGVEGFSFSSDPADAPEAELFIASNSLTEAPLDDREAWVRVIASTPNVLIVYAAVPFAGVDNAQWFQQLQDEAPGKWVQEHLPLKPSLFTLIKTESTGL